MKKWIPLFILAILFLSFEVKSQNLSTYLEAADQLYIAGQYDEAFKLYDIVINADTVLIHDYYEKAAECAEKTERNDKAIELYQKIIPMKGISGIPEKIYNNYIVLNKIKEAENCLMDAIDKNPDEADTYLKILLTHYDTWKDEKVLTSYISLYKRVLPKDSTVTQKLARHYHTIGVDSIACDLYNRLCDKSPDNREANLYLGYYYYVKGKKQIAILEDSVQKTPMISRRDHAIIQGKKRVLYSEYYAPALKYLTKANELKSSSYVEKKILKIHQLLTEEKRIYTNRPRKRNNVHNSNI